MTKAVTIVSIILLLALTGCVTYVTPARYQESTPFVKDYTILGFFSVELPVIQSSDDVQSVSEMAIKAAKAQYPEADDIIDVTITEKVKTTYIFVWWLYEYRTTLEGNVIKYND